MARQARRQWKTALRSKRGQKYNAKPVRDLSTGDSFDSTSEQKRYRILQLLERGKVISNLELHPKIVFIPKRGKAPEIAWTLDYAYDEDGQRIYEDWKPRPITDRDRLLFKLWRHYGPGPLRITTTGGAIRRHVPGRET